MAVARKKGLKDHDPDTEVEYLAFVPGDKNKEAKFITAILPLEKPQDQPNVKLELIEGDEVLGVRISRQTELTDVFLNLRADGRQMHRNSNNIINGWDTDAYIFGITRPADSADDPDSLRRCFVVSGSYLRKNGKVLIDSLSKVYSVFAAKDQEMDVILQGQPIINCRIRAKTKPQAAILNGQAASVNWDRYTSTVKFSPAN
jgi:hypothetical protein